MAALNAARAITVVSDDLGNVLKDAGIPSTKVRTIPNGVNTSIFGVRDLASCRAELGLDSGPLVVCVSRLSAEKGVRHLIEALPQLRSTIPGCQVAIVGDGAERRSLENLAHALGVEEAVRFVGAVAHDRVPLWLGAASIVCMPSLREGHPNAAMETLASGRALVASAVGSLRSMIDPEVGTLVPPGNAIALAEALANALRRFWDPKVIALRVHDASWSRAGRAYDEVLRTALLRHEATR
jgi:glycosyltransferase involved in cell wall biosynthesis